jgi:hypothetical protein
MKTKEIKPIAPTEIGLSLIVCSGPRGAVRDENLPCIEYTLQLQDSRRRPIWTGEYRLGVGHVKPWSYDDFNQARFLSYKMSEREQNLSHHWSRKPGVQFTDKQAWAETAAKLATMQKVAPKLEDVMHSLLSDGGAFFDGQRFEDWAGDYGYSADSIKAKETFEACDKIGRDLSRALSRDEIEGLCEWASNY